MTTPVPGKLAAGIAVGLSTVAVLMNLWFIVKSTDNPIRYVLPGLLVGVSSRTIPVAVLAASCAVLVMTLRGGRRLIGVLAGIGVGLLAGAGGLAIVLALTGSGPVALTYFVLFLVCGGLGALVALVRPAPVAVAIVVSAAVIVAVYAVVGLASTALARMFLTAAVPISVADMVLFGISYVAEGITAALAVAVMVWMLVKSSNVAGQEARGGPLIGLLVGGLQVVPAVIGLVAVLVPVRGETAGTLLPLAAESVLVGLVGLVVAILAGLLTALIAKPKPAPDVVLEVR
jgi:hypothetical protein